MTPNIKNIKRLAHHLCNLPPVFQYSVSKEDAYKIYIDMLGVLLQENMAEFMLVAVLELKGHDEALAHATLRHLVSRKYIVPVGLVGYTLSVNTRNFLTNNAALVL